MTTLHVQWMDLPGPTDVMSFPMDELTPGHEGEDPEEGILGTSCAVPLGRAEAGDGGRSRPRRGTPTAHDPRHPAPAGLLTTPSPRRRREMFDLQRTLLLTFLAGRGRPV